MLKGFFLSLLVYGGKLLRQLAYGEEGIEIKEKYGEEGTFLKVLLSLVSVAYVFFLIALFGGILTNWYEYLFLIVTPVAYILFVVYARNWTKKAVVEQQKERAEERKRQAALEEKEKLAQQERENKEKAQKDALVKAFTEEAGTMQTFIENARVCTTFSEVLALWDSLSLVESEVSDNIHNKIYSAVKRERIYGSTPREITAFLDELQRIYADAVLEAQLQEAQKKEPLTGLAAFHAFVEESRDGKNYREMLAMWKEVDIGDPDVHEKILQELTSRAKSERIYGSTPQEWNNFLDELVKEYASNDN